MQQKYLYDLFDPQYISVIEKYKDCCPFCDEGLVHQEGSFYCPNCGFSEYDFDMERKR